MNKINETKENIIHQALILIKERGYDQVTINDICDASKISKNTFYYYFKSKEEVLMKFFRVPYDMTIQRMTDIITMESPLEKFFHVNEPRIEHFQNLGQEILKRVMIINLQRNIGTFKTHKEKESFYRLELELLSKAQEQKEIRNQSKPIELLHSIKMQSMGAVLAWAVSGEQFDLIKKTRLMIEVLLDVREDLRSAPCNDELK